jgi:predicted house-cleaning noncanonical NTP pyrophosphatase (MazG superfamily)
MKKLCILCEVDNVDKVKSKLRRDNILHIGVSPSGQNPATHMFCKMFTTDEKTKRLMDIREYTVIEEVDDVSEFLKEKGLRIIDQI